MTSLFMPDILYCIKFLYMMPHFFWNDSGSSPDLKYLADLVFFSWKGGVRRGRRIILFAVGKGPLPIFVLLVISLNFLVETGTPTPYRSAHEYNGVTVYVPLLLHHCYLRYTCKYTVVISVVNIFHLWSSKLQLLFFKSQKYFFYSLCLNYKKKLHIQHNLNTNL